MLVSLGVLSDFGSLVTLVDGQCRILSRSCNIQAIIPRKRGLYSLDFINGSDLAMLSKTTVSLFEFHCRIGHVSQEYLRKMILDKRISGIDLDTTSIPQFCDVCVHAKMTRTPIPKEQAGPEATNIGDVLHTDVWGPAPMESIGGRKYFVTFTDEATRETIIRPLQTKAEVFEAYKKVEAYFMTQYGA